MNRNLGKSAAALTIQYCILAFISILPVGVSAQDDSAAGQPEVLLVAAGHCPPFVIQDKGEFTGLGVLLWQQIATSIGVKYELVDMSLSEMLEAIAEEHVRRRRQRLASEAETR